MIEKIRGRSSSPHGRIAVITLASHQKPQSNRLKHCAQDWGVGDVELPRHEGIAVDARDVAVGMILAVMALYAPCR